MSKARGVSSHTHTRQQLNDYANQRNPNNHAYRAALDNHADQCNPNNAAYHAGREHDYSLRSDITPDLFNR